MNKNKLNDLFMPHPSTNFLKHMSSTIINLM
jgi:hypothetical protein